MSKNIKDALKNIWREYQQNSPRKQIDLFLCFVLVTGIIQTTYCLVVGNFPYGSYMGGLFATIGTFVLTANLRIQSINPKAKNTERILADYVLCMLILFVAAINFMG
eukprot:TRINITY_DN3596_c0_g1_i1.p1 TRINITY_DN3596_c0_g1~~TRINITY_DN3596_c0_g1_i1.p1  ORF type:complete len:107 (+),score=6.61 TRINITY_DN3596_c0_g1_i1:60-380(+)